MKISNFSIVLTIVILMVLGAVSQSFTQPRNDNSQENSNELKKQKTEFGYHSHNYKQPIKARKARTNKNKVAIVESEQTLAENYKMPMNRARRRKFSTESGENIVPKNYKMPKN